MLKKLFVSLLILSALTSEGVMSLPVGMYSFYLCPVNTFGLLGETEPTLETQPSNSQEGYALFCRTVINNTSALSGAKNLKIKAFIDAYYSVNKHYLPCLSIGNHFIPNFLQDKDVIVRETDVSPPYTHA